MHPNATSMKELLIVANTPSSNTRGLACSVVDGAINSDSPNVKVVFKQPLEADASDVLSADGIIIGTTENFAYMSGLIKDFFERIYYPCLEEKQGLPYALYIRAGNDGTGTQLAVEKIITGLRWKAISDCVILRGDFNPEFHTQCEEIGMLMAAGLDAGVF